MHRERLDTSLKIPGKSHTGFLHPPPATRSCWSKGSSLCHWSSSLCWPYNFCQHHQTKGFFSQSHTVDGMSPTYPFYLYDVHYLCEQKTGNSELCLPRLPQPATTKHLEAAQTELPLLSPAGLPLLMAIQNGGSHWRLPRQLLKGRRKTSKLINRFYFFSMETKEINFFYNRLFLDSLLNFAPSSTHFQHHTIPLVHCIT